MTKSICPRKPPRSDPTIIADPVAMPPHANTRSLGPVHPAASSASTIQASTAPVWNVNPSPISTLATMKPAMPQPRTE